MSIIPLTPENSQTREHKHRNSDHSSRKKRRRDEEDEHSHRKKKRQSRHALTEEEPASSSGRSRKHHSTKKLSQKESQQSTQSQSSLPSKAAPSPFALATTTLYLSLSPISQSSPVNGLCAEHISPLILTYVPALEGILLSYSNPRVSNTPPREATSVLGDDTAVFGKSVAEYASSYAWLTADFLVLRPVAGAEMEGYINSQNESRLGLLCWNLFNASIERKRLPKDWRWDGPTSRRRSPRLRDADDEAGDKQEEEQRKEDEAEGGFLDGNDESVMGRHVKFKIVDWELDQSGRPVDASASTSTLVSFEGTMLSEKEEEQIIRELKIKEADRLRDIRLAREKRIAERRKRATEEAEDS